MEAVGVRLMGEVMVKQIALAPYIHIPMELCRQAGEEDSHLMVHLMELLRQPMDRI